MQDSLSPIKAKGPGGDHETLNQKLSSRYRNEFGPLLNQFGPVSVGNRLNEATLEVIASSEFAGHGPPWVT
ncbi:hypothetical protein ACVWZV_006471 [Bradyrhizobium sp. GM5.1]